MSKGAVCHLSASGLPNKEVLYSQATAPSHQSASSPAFNSPPTVLPLLPPIFRACAIECVWAEVGALRELGGVHTSALSSLLCCQEHPNTSLPIAHGTHNFGLVVPA